MGGKTDIVILGAYGFTARKIAALLDAEGIAFALAGRNRIKLEELKKEFPQASKVEIIDILKDEDLLVLAGSYGIFVNCTGPYNVYGERILRVAVEAGICYLDICGEQHFIENSFSSFEALAKQTGACIVHSLSFESALADLMAATTLQHDEDWENISTAYYFERSIPSPGTRLTMQTSRLFPTYSLKEGTLKETPIPGFFDKIEYPAKPGLNAGLFMPYPEVIFFKRKYNPVNSVSYLLIREMEAKYLIAASQPDLSMDEILERERMRQRGGPDPEACARQYFQLFLYARKSSGEESCSLLEGNNMYMLTASILVNALKAMLKNKFFPAGIFSLSETGINAGMFFSELRDKNNLKLDDKVNFRIIG